MNVIRWLQRVVHSMLLRILERGRGNGGAEILDDVRELYRERRRIHGALYARARGAWDILTLSVRPQPPANTTAVDRASRRGFGRISDDGRQAWRAMWRHPGVSVTAVTTLTVGITLTILAYAIVDSVLLRPLPFPRSDELLSIYSEFRPESGYSFDRFALSAPEISDYDLQSRTVDAAAWQPVGIAVVAGDGAATPIRAVRASSKIFRLLEVPPLLGRVLTTADDQPGAPCAVVLGHALWQERFGAAADAVGQRINLSGETCEVVGIMPAEFGFPSGSTRAWLPLAADTDPNTRGNHGLVALGRLKPGIAYDAAAAELGTLMAAWAQAYPHHRGHGIVIAPLKDDIVGPVSDQLRILSWAVALVLLLITGNTAGLLLAHGEVRQPEFAVRTALGATRASLTRQLLLEALILATGAGVASIFLAWALLDPVLQSSPVRLPRAGEVAIRPQTVAWTALATLAVGLCIGLLPAMRLTRGRSADRLKDAERGQSRSSNLRTQRIIVVTQLALAVALTAGAILLAQSFVQLQRVPLGFGVDNLASAIVSLPEGPGGSSQEPQQFFAALIERLAGLPGIEAAGAISDLPLQDTPAPDDFTIEGQRVPEPSEPGFNAHYVMVTAGAFETLGIQLIRGRAVQRSDAPEAPAVAVINETAAAKYWGGQDPLGQRIRYATGVSGGRWSGWGAWLTIVGIARDVRFEGPAVAARPAIYVSHAQRPRAAYPGHTMTVVLRHAPGVSDSAGAVRAVARELHPGATVSIARPMEAVVAAALARPQFMGWMMGAFALVGLGIAAVGLYGVVAYGVARRTREIGLRIALGSGRANVAWLIGRQTMVLVIAGLLMGTAGAAWMAESMRAVLFGVQPLDPAIYLSVAAILALVMCAAVALPIRRAVTADPITALRSE